MRVLLVCVGSVMIAALALGACSSASSDDDLDGGGCAGAACMASGQVCPAGEVVAGFNDDGSLVCVPQTGGGGLAQQQCSGQQVVGGIRADGSIICVDQVQAGSCEGGQFMTGISSTGEPTCGDIPPEVVRDYVNSNCYVYFGWSDSCDGCVDPPAKIGRTRGLDGDCGASGSDSTCATFDLFGQIVEMAGINTDGDVNGDDKFWVGIKCQ